MLAILLMLTLTLCSHASDAMMSRHWRMEKLASDHDCGIFPRVNIRKYVCVDIGSEKQCIILLFPIPQSVNSQTDMRLQRTSFFSKNILITRKRFTSEVCSLFYPNYSLFAELASSDDPDHLGVSEPFIHEFIIRLHPASHSPSAKLIIVTKMKHQPEIATYFSDSDSQPPSPSHNNKWNESK